MYVIARESVPSVHQVDIEGDKINLGTLKDLRRDPQFSELIPELARFSMSWVRLAPSERLEEHRHPTTSIIIVTEGAGEVSGDLSKRIGPGDVVLVPPGALHGFVGREPTGFWGLSIQLEGRGLYEDLERPRVEFNGLALRGTEEKIDALIRENERYLKEYRSNPLVKLVSSDAVSNPEVRARLLDPLQAWSDCFQRVLFARAAVEPREDFRRVAEAHIAEEIGHNDSLREMRSGRSEPRWDPLLAAASNWFVESMLNASSEERVLLVHFVLEGSGEIFHEAALKAFPGSNHFALHSVVDESHFQMGVGVLRRQTHLELKPLTEALRRGWAMMDLLSRRIAELALGA